MAENFRGEEIEGDTIEINFGDKGKILIHVESKEDLEALREYDINSMLEDIDVPTQDEMEEEEKVILQDDEGTKYLKDSIEEDDEFRQLENEFSDEDSNAKEEKEAENEYNYERKSKRFSGRGPGSTRDGLEMMWSRYGSAWTAGATE